MTVTLCLFPEGGDAVVTLQDFNVEAEVSFPVRSLVDTGIQTSSEQSLGSWTPLRELMDIILGTLGALAHLLFELLGFLVYPIFSSVWNIDRGVGRCDVPLPRKSLQILEPEKFLGGEEVFWFEH